MLCGVGPLGTPGHSAHPRGMGGGNVGPLLGVAGALHTPRPRSIPLAGRTVFPALPTGGLPDRLRPRLFRLVRGRTDTIAVRQRPDATSDSLSYALPSRSTAACLPRVCWN